MLEIVVFDPSLRAHTKLTPSLEECYQSWKEIWDEEYLRINPDHKWTSDTFSRQSSVVAIFYNKTYAASVLYRPLDLRSKIDRDDSFLTYWPFEVVDKLAQTNPNVLVCTSYTVAKAFRKNKIEDFNMKDILAALTVYYFKKTAYPVMIGLSRNTRKVNEYLINMGWETFGSIEFNNEPSEMVFCRKESPSDIPEEVIRLLENALSPKRNDHINISTQKSA